MKACLEFFGTRQSRELMMHHYGELIRGASKNLLKRTYTELLEPLGSLTCVMDDKDNPNTPNTPDWKKYKKYERANNLRLYWEKVRKHKEKMKENAEWMRKVAKLYPKPTSQTLPDIRDASIISIFAKQFSPEGKKRSEFLERLQKLKMAGAGSQLPWRQIIACQIQSGKNTFTDIAQSPIIPDKKQDTALRFQFVVELAHHKHICMTQEETFGNIQLTPNTQDTQNPIDTLNTSITLSDKSGRQCQLDWDELNPCQQQKVISDLQTNKIILA